MRKRLTKQLYYGSDTIPDPETGELVAAPPPVAVNDGSDKWDLNGLVRGELYINDYAKDPALFILGSDNLVKRIGGTGTGGGSGVISVDIDILAGDGIDIGKKMVGEDLIFTVSHADTSSVESTSNRDIFLIQNLEFDDFGHVTGVNNVNAAKLFDDRYLRKDINDTAHGIITFDKDIRSTVFLDGYDGKGWEIKNNGSVWLESANIRTNAFINNHVGSPNFTSGFLNGIGWDLAPYKRFNAAEIEETKYRLELDDLIVRGKLRVFEMIISQQRGENDNVIFAGMMKVAFYDEATKRIYLDTDKGLLYNPFRTGDILMVQRFGGMPSVGNKYNVIKQYELQVTEAGIGSLTDGENRLDWVKFSNFVGKLSDIQVGDVLTRVDSVSDSTRKGIVKITTIDEIGSPYIDCVYGLKTDPVNATKARMGDLSGIRTKNNVDLTGVVGFYAQGAVLENSYIYLDNGMTVEQNFTVMNGKFESQIEGLKNDMSLEAGNILRNSSFSNNTNYWIADNVVHFINVDGKFLWMDGSFYVEKNAVADIYRDGNKNVLRILNTTIRQYNDVMTGDKPEGTYSFTFFAKVLRAGTLTAGFSGKDLFVQQQMTTSDSYQKISKAANWDGQGDFSIGFTGEILIYGVSLFNDALSDAVIKLQTQITQNAEEIKLSATKEYVNQETNKIYTKYDTSLSLKADKAELNSFKDEYNEFNQVVRRDYATQTWTANKINSEVGTIVDGKLTNYSTISQTNSAINLAVKDLASKADLRLTSEGLQLSINNVDSKANSAQNTANTAQGTADSAKNVADKNSLVTSAFYSFDSLRMRLNRRIEMGSGSNDNFTCRAGLSPDTTGPAFWAGSTWEDRANSAIRLGHDGAGWLAKKNIMWDAAGNTQYTGKITSNNDGNRIIIDPSERVLNMISDSYNVLKMGFTTDRARQPYIRMFRFENTGVQTDSLSLNVTGFDFADSEGGGRFYIHKRTNGKYTIYNKSWISQSEAIVGEMYLDNGYLKVRTS